MYSVLACNARLWTKYVFKNENIISLPPNRAHILCDLLGKSNSIPAWLIVSNVGWLSFWSLVITYVIEGDRISIIRHDLVKYL